MKNHSRAHRLAAVRRLRLIAGQIRGLEKMVEENKYCINVIHQSLAVKKALSSFEDLILENHLTTHVTEQIRSGKETTAIKEIMTIYKLSKKK